MDALYKIGMFCCDFEDDIFCWSFWYIEMLPKLDEEEQDVEVRLRAINAVFDAEIFAVCKIGCASAAKDDLKVRVSADYFSFL